MKILAPIDGSACSFRALRFAADLTRRYDGQLDVIHITDYEGEQTEELIERAETILMEEGIVETPEVKSDLRMSKPRYADRVGKDILDIVEEEGHDHVVMGHHGSGAIGRMIIGSAAETVIRATDTPATIIP